MVVKQIGKLFCVVHCKGLRGLIGQPIKCFEKEPDAQAMHRAIKTNQGRREQRQPKKLKMLF